MLGLSDKSWIIEMIHEGGSSSNKNLLSQMGERSIYSAYFGLGHTIQLVDKPGVFKVSLAGMALGSYLLTKVLDTQEMSGRFLDMGTGSGVLALLLRSL